MTPDKMLQAVVEAAGECWHEWRLGACEKCKTPAWLDNPSPTDLNEIARLERKLKIRFRILTNYDGNGSCLVEDIGGIEREHMPTEAEARLTALYESLPKGEK